MQKLWAAVVIAAAAAAASLPGIAAPGKGGFTCTEIGPLPAPPSNRPRNVLRVRVKKGLRTVIGMQSVRFAPENATDRLVFRLWPNEPYLALKGARLTVTHVRSRGRALRVARPNPTTLVVQRALGAGEPIAVSMRWRLHLPNGPLDRLYGGPIGRLGSFFPLLAWDARAGWQTDPPSAFGWETWTSPTADFDVRVAAPRGLRVLASGARIGRGRWRVQAVRDFALAVGRFKVVTGTASAPNRVRLTVGATEGRLSLARRYLADARVALEAHARRFGPYPWTTFTAVASDTYRFSYEYPTLVFQSAGDPDPRRGIAHELGHQWFYSLVGNNQARDPWLDEALASWAQARFSNDLAALRAIAIPEPVRNRLGQPMTFWDQFDIPTFGDGAYIQGVQALASLGDPEIVDCALRVYVRQNAYRTATPKDLLRALEMFFPDARRKLEAYGAVF